MKQVAYEETQIENNKMEQLMPLSGPADVQYENFCANGILVLY